MMKFVLMAADSHFFDDARPLAVFDSDHDAKDALLAKYPEIDWLVLPEYPKNVVLYGDVPRGSYFYVVRVPYNAFEITAESE